ncbi:MAG: hypothetical protein R3F46_06300 [bacterium]
MTDNLPQKQEVIAALHQLMQGIPKRNLRARYWFTSVFLLATAGVWLNTRIPLEDSIPQRIILSVLLLGITIAIMRIGDPVPDQKTAKLVRSLAIRNLTENNLIVDTLEAANSAELLDPAMRGKTPMFSDLRAAPFRTTANRFLFLANQYAQICYNRKLNFEHSHFKFEQNPSGRNPGSTAFCQYDAIVIQALIDILEGRVDGTGDNGGVEKMK